MLNFLQQMFGLAGKGNQSCVICKREFVHTPLELRFYKENDVAPPQTCRLCRNLRRYDLDQEIQPSIANFKK